MYTIVVGVDESEGSRKALEWAAEQAAARNGKLILVHAYQVLAGYQPDPEKSDTGGTGETPVEEETRKAAETFLKGLVAELPDDLEVETVVTKGRSSEVLLEHAEGADVIAVGSRGRGGFTGLLLGSVSQQVVQHASCPVVVVPKAA
ncbi:MAG: universal stress protein [Actinomycetota bacterium]